MRVAVFLCIFASITSSASAAKKRYDGYKVVRVIPTTVEQLDVLRAIQATNEVDFWKEPTRLNSFVDILVSPQQFAAVSVRLVASHLNLNIVRHNVQEQLDKELGRFAERFREPDQYAFNIDDYNTYNDIMTYLDDAALNKCPTGFTCTIENIGKSVEGRDLKLLKITKGSGRKIIWSDSLIHAREWLSGATILKILDNFLTNYGKETNVTQLMDKYDFYFLPCMNPDGYIFSWTDERFWRKNRSINPNQECVGTDLNRNYDAEWMHDGTDDDECSDTYGGPSAASEPETQAVQNYLKANGANMLAAISAHTYVAMWLHPYGHTDNQGNCVRSPDHDNQNAVANAAANATQNTFNEQQWDRGNTCETIYPASGSTCDYMYSSGKIKYSYTPELRGPFFDPGKEAITPSFTETWNGYRALIAKIESIEQGSHLEVNMAK